MRTGAAALCGWLALAGLSCSSRRELCAMAGASIGADAGTQGTTGPLRAEAGANDARMVVDAPPPTTPPTWSTEFTDRGDQWPYLTFQMDGQVEFGLVDPRAEDGKVAELVFPGAPGLGPGDRQGIAFATEIETSPVFGYGTYRTRLTLPTCDPSEEVVTGFFTYFNDGKDENGNGIIDNAEVDIEILCGSPHVISMAIWTDYTSDSSFLAMGASVDLSTGSFFQSKALNMFGESFVGTRPELVHPEFPDPNAFYEMGFDWQRSEVRFFVVLGGAEITLWDYTDAQHIPSLTSVLGYNVWHAFSHWAGDGTSANYPAQNAVTRIDWARYWQ
jgi:hypothetical protein